ncbi:MAG: type II secretion system F family protein [Acidimicrobiia bacterium]
MIFASLASAALVAVVGTVLARAERADAARRPRTPRTVPGLEITAVQFWSTVVAVAALTFVVLYALTSLVVVSTMPAVVVATFPRAYFARKRAQRVAAVQEAWPDGLRDLVTSVRSGSSLPSAIEALATFGPEPLRRAFQGFAVYARSLGVVAALEMVKEDLADPTSDRVIEVLILAYQRGGTVVPEILSDLAEATTRDLWAMEQVRTEVLEQKINSRVVFVLPWLVLVAMTARSGAFREFYGTPAGVLVVVIGGAMSLVGMVVTSRLGGQPAEPRVFGGQG